MVLLIYVEVISGVAALVFSAMAFTHLSWSEGAASQALQRQSLARSKRLGLVACILWAVCVACYLAQR